MEVKTEETKNAVVLSVGGSLDSTSSPELGECLEPVITEGDKAVVLDLSGTSYVSSAGLRVLLSTTKRLRAAGRSIVVCGVSANIMEVIKVTGFHRILEIRDTLEQALEVVS